MLSLGAISFAGPWLLLALGVLPLLWWLLRATPPAPRLIAFPATRLLLGLAPTEETPAHTPWWLLLLRLVIVGLVIVGLARPILNAGAELGGAGPLLLVIDDGWAAAANWERRQTTVLALIEKAARTDRPVRILTTAPAASGQPISVSAMMTAAEAHDAIQSLEPKPWPTNRNAALAAVEASVPSGPAQVMWIADGLAGDGGAAAAGELATMLQRLGPVTMIDDEATGRAVALRPPEAQGSALHITALRATATVVATRWLRATGESGVVLGREALLFEAGSTQAEAVLELPRDLRNRITRLEIEGEASAGAVVLLDERWRRRPVGLASGGSTENAQPLLSDLFYLERALEPFGDVVTGTIDTLIESALAVIMLADIGQIVGPDRSHLDQWVRAGGVVVRFAGPRLAERVDDLVPVALRSGGRLLGGAMTWGQAARLAPFEGDSPFHGLVVPEDVEVRRQVLAQPSLDLVARTWARLEDGTPLVTAEQRDQGWVVLFHTTANTEWSNLPLSGLFVAMLRRLTDLSQGVLGDGGETPLPPLLGLDGFGRLGEPSPAARAIAPSSLLKSGIGPHRPPGFYGSEQARRAVNLGASILELTPIAGLPQGLRRTGFDEDRESDIAPWLLALAVVLLLVDLVVSLALRGLLAPRHGVVAGMLIGALWIGATPTSFAIAGESEDRFAIDATRETRLAYVLTGDRDIDGMSAAGLRGLTRWLAERTAVEAAAPMGLNVETDALVFFPLLYWPMTPDRQELGDTALAKLDAYMKSGGTILFDTRDQGEVGALPPRLRERQGGLVGIGTQSLRRLLSRLDIPPLIPLPADHVLTKTFYLLDVFPGRWEGGTLWIERDPHSINDGVSSVIIGANDWAAAWAEDEAGRPLAALVPGGPRQRELAFRFGTNLVMYALTGNYKADQVHVPAILERLGQ